MDAITLIKEKMDVEKLLNHYNFKEITVNGDIIRACCKIHDGNNPTAFVINKNTGLWYCHTGDCGGGDIFTLVQRMENITGFQTTVQWISNFFNIDIKNLLIIENKSKYDKELREFISIVKNKKKKEFKEYTIPEQIKEVTKYRNFKLETLQHFKLGYVDEITLEKRKKNGVYKLHNRLVFPVIFNKIQIGIILRRIKSNDYPKWSNQPAHLETRNILYNYDNVVNSHYIVICEGITDVWAFYELNIPAVCIFGSHITKEQYKLLLQTGADLIFAYDGDDAGYSATQKAIKMFKNKANIQVIYFNKGTDPASISREELLNEFRRRENV